jgi:hypothetical protein
MDSRASADSGYSPGLLRTNKSVPLKMENKMAIMLNHAKQSRTVQRLASGMVDCAVRAGEIEPGPRRTDTNTSTLEGQLTCHGTMDAY